MNDIPAHFTWLQRTIPATVALIIVLLTLELVRRRKLREEYAMLWLAASAVLVVFAMFPKLLWIISNWLGVYYLTTLVILSFGFLSLVVVHFAVVISRMSESARQTAQRVALLEQKIEQLSNRPAATDAVRGEESQ
jgi:hypothetical protein